MAKVEHELTAMKGKPVTMLRESAKKSNEGVRFPIFLKYNPDYPEIKTLNDVKGREPKSMVDCNGFCGINDLTSKNELEENEINYEQESDEDLLQRLMGNIEK